MFTAMYAVQLKHVHILYVMISTTLYQGRFSEPFPLSRLNEFHKDYCLHTINQRDIDSYGEEVLLHVRAYHML